MFCFVCPCVLDSAFCILYSVHLVSVLSIGLTDWMTACKWHKLMANGTCTSHFLNQCQWGPTQNSNYSMRRQRERERMGVERGWISLFSLSLIPLSHVLYTLLSIPHSTLSSNTRIHTVHSITASVQNLSYMYQNNIQYIHCTLYSVLKVVTDEYGRDECGCWGLRW